VVPDGLAEDRAEPLRLLPGDEVTLQTVSAETTDYTGLLIDELGILHVPLAGDVEIGGLTLAEAEQRVQTALRRYDTVVVVNLFLTDPNGHRATVLGAVEAPGRVAIAPGTRLADLIALAGGPLKETESLESHLLSDLHGARLLRGNEAVPVSLPLAMQGHPRHNVRIRAGDHLYIPPARGQRLSILGEVNSPSVIPHRSGIRLLEALAMAGGITFDGDRADVRVIRGPLREPQVYTTDTVDIVNGRAPNIELAPGDIVFVTEHWIASVGEVLNRLSPLLSTATAFGLTYTVTR
jgi:polysaccharide export outer membrane protein